MELCAGTLEVLVDGSYRGPVPGEIKEVLYQITLGLSYLHSIKIVHRNLKPQNILISLPEQGSEIPKIKVADFGLDKQHFINHVSQMTRTPAGAVGWRAPEFDYDDPTTCEYSVDIFSLGCVFGYVLTGGHHPYGKTVFRAANIERRLLDWEKEEEIKDHDFKKFVRKMITYEPNVRPRIEEVLQRFDFQGSTGATEPARSGSSSGRRIPRDGSLIGEPTREGVEIYETRVNGQLRAIKRIDKKKYARNYAKEIEILTKPEMSGCLYLVRYFTHEEDDQFCYIEMEMFTGSLFSFVQRKRLSNLFDGDTFMKKRTFQKNIIEGITFLHETVDLIHRDIQPANILIFKHGNMIVPKIADYGISEIGENKETEMFRGTDGWKAPELKAQLGSKAHYTKAVDIFAAGCLLFYIETEGGHPFNRSLTKIGRGTQRNIDNFNPNLTSLSYIEATLVDLLCRALERELENRITASEMLNHPAFYSYEKSLYYLRWASEQSGKEMEKRLDKYAPGFKRVIINGDWRNVLEEAVLEEAKLGPNRSFIRKFNDADYGKSVVNLLALIRNKYAHYDEISDRVKQIVGQIPDRYFQYWYKKFPHLLTTTWNTFPRENPTFKTRSKENLRPVMLVAVQDLIMQRYDDEKLKMYRAASTVIHTDSRKEGNDYHKQNTGSSSWGRFVGGVFSFVGKRIFGADNTMIQTRPMISSKGKKSFFDFLTDYSIGEFIEKQLQVTDDLETSKKRITHRLRHRMDLTVSEDNDEVVCEAPNAVRSRSAYDTLLELIDDYDPSGVCEIYHLLLEAKFTVPLFNPLTYQHYLLVLKEICANVVPNEPDIRLGEDTSLSRIVLISCRTQTETQSLELMKSLFNLDTFHRNDLFKNTFTRQNFTIDLGIGYIGRKAQNTAKESDNPHVLVAHVFGCFEDAMEFVNGFADVILVEDAAPGDSSSFGSIVRSRGKQVINGEALQILVWKPTTAGIVICQSPEETAKKHHYVHTRVSVQYGERLVAKLSSILREMFKMRRLARKGISQHSLLANETSPFAEEIRNNSDVNETLVKLVPNVIETRMSLVLQRNFCEQAMHEEKKRECRLIEDTFKLAEASIEVCIRKRIENALHVGNVGLVKYFLVLLRNPEQRIRIMKLRQMEQVLNRLTDMELEKQQVEINQLHTRLIKSGAHLSKENNENALAIKEMYVKAKVCYRESMLHMEHLWRELSHLYVANPSTYVDLPRSAAQHMLDGFSVELLDGDANLINLPWISAIFSELNHLMEIKKRRIFVLSVMGVQSSGKSTLLNTMFGIKMRTSVGQCTRGINMQLVPVEGRPEYDYVLILDTEGTRSPEHWGVPGNEKRDNQMATISILLADATIIVNPGENDAAIKEILPIVLMAYQNSKLAEDTCGRMSSMMFFVYNRIDTTQQEKFTNIIQALSNSLMDAFKTVQQMTGSKAGDSLDSTVDNNESQLFRHFVLDVSNLGESDVRILGQNKKSFVPPDNVPDSAYGETLVEFREHIHKRITQQSRNGVKWQGHFPDELSKYLEDTWDCISSADFTLQFSDVLERVAFDKLEAEYQKIERRLARQYQKQFAELRRSMVREALVMPPGDQMSIMERNEHCSTLQQTLEADMGKFISNLNKDFASMICEKGRERWRPSFEQRWQLWKSKQDDFWSRQLRQSFDTIFCYYSQLENLKSSLRQSINRRFTSGLFRPSSLQLRSQFDELISKFIADAEKCYPTIDVEKSINAFYAQSAIIQSQQLELLKTDYEIACKNIISKLLSTINQHQADQKVRNIIRGEVKNFWSTKGKRQERGGSSPPHQQIAACLIKIKEFIFKLLSTIQCYDEGVISELIERTQEILQESGLKRIDYSHRQFAHTFARLLLISKMQQIQEKWESHNSIPAKLKSKSTDEMMWEYFQMVSGGAKKIRLFGLLVKEKMIKSQESYKAEAVAITVKRIRQWDFINNFYWVQYQMELHLSELVRKNQVSEIVSYIRFPNDLRSTVIYNFVSSMVKHVTLQEKKWEHYVKDLKGAVKQATKTALEVKRNRATGFLKAMGECLGRSLVSDYLIQSLGTNLGSEYNELDNELASEFRKDVQKVLEDALEKEKPPADMEEFTHQATELAIETLRKNSGPNALLWCDHCCPWCGSMCNREAGHDVSQFKHDTVHQPAGLVGREFGNLKILEARPCSDFDYKEHFQGKVTDDEETSFHFRDWCTVFPDWEKPRGKERSLLREFIFYHYHTEFAKHYGLNPTPSAPAKYNRDLNSIMYSLYWGNR